MEFLLIIALGIGAFFVFRKRGTKNPPDYQQRNYETAPVRSAVVSRTTSKRPVSNTDDEEDEGDDDEGGQWISKRHKVGVLPRPAGMVPLPGMSSVILKGTAHRVKEVKTFIEMMRAVKPTVSLRFERETTNPHDKNAIRIWGTGSRGGQFNLGYVPAESAKAIADAYSEAMPISAELVSSGYTSAGDAAYVKVRLLGPSAAERKKFIKHRWPGRFHPGLAING